ncbi:MAG TPA: hypothetical protein VGI39_01275 [Polyangiaceae bacterium]
MTEIDYERFEETRERVAVAEPVPAAPSGPICLHSPSGRCRACAPDSAATRLLATMGREQGTAVGEREERLAKIRAVYGPGHDCDCTPAFLLAELARAEAERDSASNDIDLGFEQMKSRAEKAEAALKKIDAIRNSIVGRQGVHWSLHIYPLVAALDEAGLGGEGYDVARPKAEAQVAAVRAVYDRAEKAESERDALSAQVATLTTELATMTERAKEAGAQTLAWTKQFDADRKQLNANFETSRVAWVAERDELSARVASLTAELAFAVAQRDGMALLESFDTEDQKGTDEILARYREAGRNDVRAELAAMTERAKAATRFTFGEWCAVKDPYYGHWWVEKGPLSGEHCSFDTQDEAIAEARRRAEGAAKPSETG